LHLRYQQAQTFEDAGRDQDGNLLESVRDVAVLPLDRTCCWDVVCGKVDDTTRTYSFLEYTMKGKSVGIDKVFSSL